MSDMSVGAVQLCVSAWHRAREYPQKPQIHKKSAHTSGDGRAWDAECTHCAEGVCGGGEGEVNLMRRCCTVCECVSVLTVDE